MLRPSNPKFIWVHDQATTEAPLLAVHTHLNPDTQAAGVTIVYNKLSTPI